MNRRSKCHIQFVREWTCGGESSTRMTLNFMSDTRTETKLSQSSCREALPWLGRKRTGSRIARSAVGDEPVTFHIQSTLRITTLGGASEKCPYSRSVVIPEVSFYVLQWGGTLLWAWKFCRYSRIVVISAVVISEVDCTRHTEVSMCMYTIVSHSHPVLLS